MRLSFQKLVQFIKQYYLKLPKLLDPFHRFFNLIKQDYYKKIQKSQNM